MSIPTWTAAQKKAYAIKKSRERSLGGRLLGSKKKPVPVVPKPGYLFSPHEHRCEAHDIVYNDVTGHRCRGCGRRWVYEPGIYDNEVWRTGPTFKTKRCRNYPLTPSPPPLTPHEMIPPRSVRRAIPKGTLGELPPEDLLGKAVGEWWVASWRARHPQQPSYGPQGAVPSSA